MCGLRHVRGVVLPGLSVLLVALHLMGEQEVGMAGYPAQSSQKGTDEIVFGQLVEYDHRAVAEYIFACDQCIFCVVRNLPDQLFMESDQSELCGRAVQHQVGSETIRNRSKTSKSNKNENFRFSCSKSPKTSCTVSRKCPTVPDYLSSRKKNALT